MASVSSKKNHQDIDNENLSLLKLLILSIKSELLKAIKEIEIIEERLF